MADTETATVTRLRPKARTTDVTAALRQKRARRKRKTSPSAVTISVPTVTVERTKKPNGINPTVTVDRNVAHQGADVAAYVAAIALAGAAAWFSICFQVHRWRSFRCPACSPVAHYRP